MINAGKSRISTPSSSEQTTGLGIDVGDGVSDCVNVGGTWLGVIVVVVALGVLVSVRKGVFVDAGA